MVQAERKHLSMLQHDLIVLKRDDEILMINEIAAKSKIRECESQPIFYQLLRISSVVNHELYQSTRIVLVLCMLT